jgi:hypothetical protein
VPGRGPALDSAGKRVQAGLAYTRDFVSTLLNSAKEAVALGMNLNQAMAHARKAMDPKFGHVFIYEHCLPFDVTRAVDEASGIKHPRASGRQSATRRCGTVCKRRSKTPDPRKGADAKDNKRRQKC